MEEKIVKKVDNSSYRERFQFLLYVNENVICQRYFRINNFDYQSIESLELKEVMDDCVRMIQKDLVEKSRVYMWYTDKSPIKMTGFCNDEDLSYEDVAFLTNGREEEGTLTNGKHIKKTFFDYFAVATNQMEYTDERPADGEVTFKFVFLMDDKVLYEQQWDANTYPKYVRNSVDLSNSNAIYRNKDVASLSFSLAIIYHMTNGKIDLLYGMIKKICDTLSNSYSSEYDYTKSEVYKTKDNDGNVVDTKTYYYSTYNKEFVNGWRKATMKKTVDYMNSLYPTQGQLDYIDKYL